MTPAKRALAIAAITTTLVSCSSRPFPAATPTMTVNTARIYTTTAVYPLVADLTLAYHEAYVWQEFDIAHANFQVMLARLEAGAIPYFFSNHLPGDYPLWAAPIGQDGIAIIVNARVDVGELTMEQLRAIYQGRLTRWEVLGGSLGEIVVFSRERGSGTRAEFERMVMGYRQTSPNAHIAASSAQMIDYVAQVEGSIGYVSMGYLGVGGVNALAVEGVLPHPDTVFNHQYPLRSTIFVVGLGEPDGIYRRLFGWAQSPAGQSVVAQRYAPMFPVVEDASTR